MANTQQAPVLRAKGEKFQNETMKGIMGWKLKEIIYNNLGERDFAMWKVIDFLITNASEAECKSKGKEPFRIAEKTICERVNISETGYKNARTKLVKKGWIEHKKDGYITVLYDNIYKCGQGSTENTPKIKQDTKPKGSTEDTSSKKLGITENTPTAKKEQIIKGSTENTPSGITENTPSGSTENTYNNITNTIKDNIIREETSPIVGDALPGLTPPQVEALPKQKEEVVEVKDKAEPAVCHIESTTEQVIKIPKPLETASKEPPKAPVKSTTIGYIRKGILDEDPTIHFALDEKFGVKGAWIWRDGDKTQQFKGFRPE